LFFVSALPFFLGFLPFFVPVFAAFWGLCFGGVSAPQNPPKN
jgi:hypothetical protein